MTTPEIPKFGVKFPSRQERTVKLVTKSDTCDIKKKVESSKPKPVKKAKPPPPPPATLVKPVKPLKRKTNPPARTLQLTDLEKLARLNCSREFSLFHQYIKSELSKTYENQLAFLQTKLQHLKNEFVNKQGEHLNFEQIKEYYQQAVQDNIRRQIKPDEYLTLENKFKEEIKQAIEKWIRKKDYKAPKQVNPHLQRRQERIRDQIRETLKEQKRQQQQQAENQTESRITISSVRTSKSPVTIQTVQDDDDDDDIMIID